MKRKIYLDNAATTKVDPQVLEAMLPYFSEKFGNASEIHQWGVDAKEGKEKAREQIAKKLNCQPKEIIFTSCATESINLAHKGLVENEVMRVKKEVRSDEGEERSGKLPHIITTQIEHKAVLESCKHLEKLGWAEVTYLGVDHDGLVDISELEKVIRPETVLVSVMYVNNEVGTIEPIVEIGQLIKKINISRLTSHLTPINFHTDATQGLQYLDCDVDKLGVDLLSLTGHKLGAPKGIGALFVRKGVKLIRQQDGGGQERNLRAGTENVPYIVGLGKAVEQTGGPHFAPSTSLRASRGKLKNEKTEKLRDKLIEGVLKIPNTLLTGHPEKRAPHVASFVIKGVEGESMLLLFNEAGVAVSTGSACNTGDLAPSHVLSAMGYQPWDAHGSLRFSLGKGTTEEEVGYVLTILPGIVEKLRKMAPKLKDHGGVTVVKK
ncbi:MAG: cysteine desulfurase family protein [bacterium]|nr:cysteine desulfurase family protein [bacterium]